MSLHAGRPLPVEDGGSEEERWRPESQRARHKRHGREAERGQHEAAAAEERDGNQLNVKALKIKNYGMPLPKRRRDRTAWAQLFWGEESI